MKCLWLKLFLISFIWGQEAQYQRDGDPKDLSFPGGYAGISYELDLKSKEKGYQISFGMAIPGIGESGGGPYIFPGIAFGKRYPQNSEPYTYFDLQMVGMMGGWLGFGYGTAFKDGKKHVRTKKFIGFLLAGYVTERTQTSNTEWQSAFSGAHLGFALPIVGNHFHP